MTARTEILNAAEKAVSGARDAEYGTPQKNLGNIATLWSSYLCRKFDGGPTPVLTAEDVAHMMVLLKIARTMGGNAGPDTYVDAAGYAALAGELSGHVPPMSDDTPPDKTTMPFMTGAENIGMHLHKDSAID